MGRSFALLLENVFVIWIVFVIEYLLHIKSTTSLYRPRMGSTLSGPFRKMMGLGVRIPAWEIVWDRKKAIDIGEWSIYRGG